MQSSFLLYTDVILLYSFTTGGLWKSENPYWWLIGAGTYMEQRAKGIISTFLVTREGGAYKRNYRGSPSDRGCFLGADRAFKALWTVVTHYRAHPQEFFIFSAKGFRRWIELLLKIAKPHLKHSCNAADLKKPDCKHVNRKRKRDLSRRFYIVTEKFVRFFKRKRIFVTHRLLRDYTCEQLSRQ